MVMMTASLRAWLIVLLFGATLISVGCVDIGNETAPSRFYVLSAGNVQGTPSSDGPVLLVGPITLPRYLDRPQIVTRPSPNQLALAEYDRWGGRLDDNFSRVLAQNLGVHLNTSRIAMFPRDQRLAEALQVSVDVAHFEQVGDQGQVELDAQWSLHPADRRVSPLSGLSRIRIPVTGSGFAATAAAMSVAIDNLAQEIAIGARKLPQTKAS